MGQDKAGKPSLTLQHDWVKKKERCRERGMSLGYPYSYCHGCNERDKGPLQGLRKSRSRERVAQAPGAFPPAAREQQT